MLVLTRRLNQVITLGDPAGNDPPIEITITEVRGDQVRLGIVAPQTVAVHRKEIYLQIKQENQASSENGKPSTVGKTLDQIRKVR